MNNTLHDLRTGRRRAKARAGRDTISLLLPTPVRQAFRDLAEPEGAKRHWLVATAAVLLARECAARDPARYRQLLELIWEADFRGETEALSAMAGGGGLSDRLDETLHREVRELPRSKPDSSPRRARTSATPR